MILTSPIWRPLWTFLLLLLLLLWLRRPLYLVPCCGTLYLLSRLLPPNKKNFRTILRNSLCKDLQRTRGRGEETPFRSFLLHMRKWTIAVVMVAVVSAAVLRAGRLTLVLSSFRFARKHWKPFVKSSGGFYSPPIRCGRSEKTQGRNVFDVGKTYSPRR